MQSYLTLLILALPLTAAAEERWVPISKPNPPIDALLLDVEHVIMNDNGNRVATIRSITAGGFRMDTVTEFDCRAQRQRSLSSALNDKDGRLISASEKSNTWFGGKDAIGLETACNALITKP